MKPFKVRAKEAKRRWDSEAGLLRDAATLRLIVKHRLSVWKTPGREWNAVLGSPNVYRDKHRTGRTIHTAVRRSAKEAR